MLSKKNQVSRRTFIKLASASTLALYVSTQFGGVKRLLAQIPGGTLDPLGVPKYAEHLCSSRR